MNDGAVEGAHRYLPAYERLIRQLLLPHEAPLPAEAEAQVAAAAAEQAAAAAWQPKPKGGDAARDAEQEGEKGGEKGGEQAKRREMRQAGGMAVEGGAWEPPLVLPVMFYSYHPNQ